MVDDFPVIVAGLPRHGPAIVAAGDAPAWRIVRRGHGLVLIEAGRPPATLTVRDSHPTLAGAEMRGTLDNGATFTIKVQFAACRLRSKPGTASYIAWLTIDGRRLRGCYLAPPPGLKPSRD